MVGSRRTYSFKCDWWAVGVVLYELLFGRPPFDVEDRTVLFKKITDEPVRFPSSLVQSGHVSQQVGI